MSIHFNEELIEKIKTQNDIVDIISKYVQLKKSGHNYKGLCPFHNEKTPSFMVSNEKQLYHCFGCGESGDVINFVMKIENLDFIDAVRLMAEWVGINYDEISTSKQENEEIYRKNKLYGINREAALFYYRNLLKKENNGLKYLLKRGLTIQTIKKFGLGYAKDHWESLNSYLLSKGYDQKLIYRAGLVSERKNKDGYYDRFRNRVMFPIINTTGKVIGFGGRIIGDNNPKYINSPETPIFNKGNNLFGLNLAKNEVSNKKQIIVVEGYMDVISLYQNGIKNVTASLGTALTKNQANLLKRYADEIVIAYDSDTAGQAATLRGLDILREAGCQVKVVCLSEGKDPDEFVIKKGKDAFLKEVDNALSLIDYKIMLSKKENDLKTIEGRVKFVKSITKILKELKSPVEVDAYIKKIASESQISIEAIKSEIYGNNMYNKRNIEKKSILNTSKYRSKHDRYTNKYNIQPLKPTEKIGYLEAERCLLKLIITNKEIFNKIKTTITYKDFIDKTNSKIAKFVYELYEENDFVDIKELLNQLSIDEISILHKIKHSIVPRENIDKALIDYINSMQKHKLMKMKIDIEDELEKLEKLENKTEEQIVRIRELCINYEKLLKELKKM
ncbi:DNA primase [Crassaminicella thermophila]|uniref:DNA primase n=1 Tax=Crassaminicella thermophila TaxID=2599308 RepID=A0A5C0SG44_CRATE|nr:DNA primase [Crassaminicella thermophila]QEK12344.1 DNA primase [Crassaminicella thermophila]